MGRHIETSDTEMGGGVLMLSDRVHCVLPSFSYLLLVDIRDSTSPATGVLPVKTHLEAF